MKALSGVDGAFLHLGTAALAAAAFRHDAGQTIKLVRHLPDVVKTLAVLVSGVTGRAAGRPQGQLGQNFSFGPKKPLIATMPISLRAAGNSGFRTQATLSLVNLNTQIADPVRRLRAIRDAAGAVKSLARGVKGVIPMDFPSIVVPWVLRGLAWLYGRSGLAGMMPPVANVVISNVPGPTVPLYTAGARMASYWPLSIVEHGVALNITVMSYTGAMGSASRPRVGPSPTRAGGHSTSP